MAAALLLASHYHLSREKQRLSFLISDRSNTNESIMGIASSCIDRSADDKEKENGTAPMTDDSSNGHQDSSIKNGQRVEYTALLHQTTPISCRCNDHFKAPSSPKQNATRGRYTWPRAPRKLSPIASCKVLKENEARDEQDNTTATNSTNANLASQHAGKDTDSHTKQPQNGTKKATHSSIGQMIFKAAEDWMFPPSKVMLDSKHQGAHVPAKVRGGVLLDGCATPEEHKSLVKQTIDTIRNMYGLEGLREIGLEYRLLPCEAHAVASDASPELPVFDQNEKENDCLEEDIDDEPHNDDEEEEDDDDSYASLDQEYRLSAASMRAAGLHLSSRSANSKVTNRCTSVRSNPDSSSVASLRDMEVGLPSPGEEMATCPQCKRRLYHIESNTLVTMENRKRWIADGDMYDFVAKLCQEYAHERMIEEGGLEWVVIEETPGKEPIRALVNSDHPVLQPGSDMNGRPTLLIATGRGKVRAGIFSRIHLMASGLESATAVPIVRAAKKRRLNVLIVDPNVNGERLGYVNFSKTMDYYVADFLPKHEEAPSGDEPPLKERDLYVLSHSASGGHFARYLLDKSDHYLPHIAAIAFTDSTHNIQWAKTKDRGPLYDLLESDKCVYFRCSNIRQESNSQWYLHSAGEPVQTDTFWKQRFGNIRTYWAGTDEHSMTNWYAHQKIWEHFDQHLASTAIPESELDGMVADVSKRD